MDVKKKLTISIATNASILFKKSNCIKGENIIIASKESYISIGENIKTEGLRMLAGVEGKIKIGDNTSFGENLKVRSGLEGNIEIGDDCMFSWDVQILGADGHAIYNVDGKQRINPPGENNLVKIGDHCWIGARTTILPGTRVGFGSVAGSNSLLNKKYPNNCIIAGIPAKIVRKDICWGRNNFNYHAEDVKDEYIQFTEMEL